MKLLFYSLLAFSLLGFTNCKPEKKTIVISEIIQNDSIHPDLIDNRIIVSKIDIDANDIESVEEKLKELPKYEIGVVNWAEKFPEKPETHISIAHNSENILLQYQVSETEILGLTTKDNGKVWTDSAVEFFVSFDDEHYYNAEFNCIGTAFLGYCSNDGTSGELAPPSIVESIKRLPSLGTIKRTKEQGLFDWTITLVIPKTAYWKENLTGFDGVKARGNFYKCGDNLTTPHFVSWTKIETPEPSFHQPAFFGTLEFE